MTVSEEECYRILRYLESKYFNIRMPIHLRFIKKIQSVKKEMKDGLKKLVRKDDDGNRYAVITLSDKNGRESIQDAFFMLMHELQHISDIEEYRLQFKGNTLIYCGREYKLRHLILGPYDKREMPGVYVHGDYHEFGSKPPWEAFQEFNARVAELEANNWTKEEAG